jgi:hypothetical protein
MPTTASTKASPPVIPSSISDIVARAIACV